MQRLRALLAEAAGDRGCPGAPGAGAKGLRKPPGDAPVGAAPAPLSAAAEAPEQPALG